MSFFRKFAVLAALGFLFVGCGEETVGEKIDSGIEKTSDAAGKALDKTADGIDNLKKDLTK